MAKKLIIDTDIGTYYDDAFAVLLATRSPEVNVLGVTTVYGDTALRSRIARKVLNVAGHSDIPVFAGIGQPLSGKHPLMFGFEGQDILEAGDEDLKWSDEHAVNFIARSIMEHPHEVSVVTLGAVSNLAVAVTMEPRIASNIKELVIMGGVVVPIVDAKGVRRSPIEEYNLNNDTTAAKIVFNSGMPITVVPIDVTLRVPLSARQVERIKNSSDRVAQLVSRIIRVWPKQEYQIYLTVGIPTEHTGLWLHDPLTVGIVCDRSLIEATPVNLSVEFAPTIVERDMVVRHDILRTIPKQLPPNMSLAVDVHAERFTELFTSRICGE